MKNFFSQPVIAAVSIQQDQILFPLGKIVVTAGVLAHLDLHAINVQPYLERHVRGDWGEIPLDDAKENVLSVIQNNRIISVYEIASERVWIITEWDRQSTSILFPAEY